MYGLVKSSFATVDELYALFDEGVAGIENMKQLKNFQRAFTVREILLNCGTNLKGKRILDVGAGFDLSTINCLQRDHSGTCFVLDDYEGEWKSRGGKTVHDLMREHPNISYVKGLCGEPGAHLLEDGSFQIIYSVSVLEHVPLENLRACIGDMDRMLGIDGLQVHTIDVPLDDGGRKLDPFLEIFRSLVAQTQRKELPSSIEEARSMKNVFLEPPDIIKKYWWPHKQRKEVMYQRWTSFNIVLRKLSH